MHQDFARSICLSVLLHEMLTVLRGSLKIAVVALCQLWWLQELEGHDLLVANVLPYLVDVATRKGAKVTL